MEKGQEYYNVCCLVNWNQEKIAIYTRSKHIEINTFKLKVLNYIKNVLKKNVYEIPRNQMNFLFSSEKIKNIETYHKVLMEMIDKKPEIAKSLMEKDNIKPILGAYFMAFLTKADFKRVKIVAKCFSWDLSCEQVINDALQYALTELNYSKEDVEKLFGKLLVKRGSTANEILNQILLLESNEMINDYLSKIGYDAIYLKKNIPDFLVLFVPIEKREKARIKLEESLNSYIILTERKTKEEQKKENRYLKETEEYKKLILEFLEATDLSKEEFCSIKNISQSKFKAALLYVKASIPTLYELIEVHERELFQKRYSYYIEIASYIINALDNGIIENGVKRNFTILDYLLLTNANLKNVLDVAKNSPLKDYLSKFQVFVSKYKRLTPITDRFIRRIMLEKVYVSIEEDVKASIPNMESIVTDDDKLMVLDYLKNNNLYYEECFDIALRRYKNKTLYQESTMRFKIH